MAMRLDGTQYVACPYCGISFDITATLPRDAAIRKLERHKKAFHEGAKP